MKTIPALLVAVLLSGCGATTSQLQANMYSQRLAEQSKVDQVKATAESDRYKTAMTFTSHEAQLAFAIGDGIASGIRAAGGGGQSQLPLPPVIEGWDDKLLRLTSVLAPVLGNVGLGVVQAQVQREGIRSNERVSIGDQQARVATISAVTGGFAAVKPSITVNGTGVVNGGTLVRSNEGANSGNSGQIGNDNRQQSAGPCVAGNGSTSPPGPINIPAAPITTTINTTTGAVQPTAPPSQTITLTQPQTANGGASPCTN